MHDKSRAAPSRCLLDSKSGDETMGAHWRLGQKSRIVDDRMEEVQSNKTCELPCCRKNGRRMSPTP